MRLLRLGAGKTATITRQVAGAGPRIQGRITAEFSGPFRQCKDQYCSDGQYDEEAGAVLEDRGEDGERKKILDGSTRGIVAFNRQVLRRDVLHGLLQVDNLNSEIAAA